jgi:hypothetical protein
VARSEARDRLLRKTLNLWEELDARTPYSVRPATRIMDLADRLGETEIARQAAVEALRRDELTRLDPLMGLTDAQRAQAHRILVNPAPEPED